MHSYSNASINWAGLACLGVVMRTNPVHQFEGIKFAEIISWINDKSESLKLQKSATKSKGKKRRFANNER